MENAANTVRPIEGVSPKSPPTASATTEAVMTDSTIETRTGSPFPAHRWLGFFAVLASLIMNLLDSTVVNVAAPSIRKDLGASYSDIQWIAAGYTLALAVGL